MNRSETAKLLAAIRALWPHSDLGDLAIAVDVWGELLEPVPYESVKAALGEYAATGEKFAPGAGVLLNLAVEREVDVPEWDEALREIEYALKTYRLPRGTVVTTEAEMYAAPPADYWSHPALAIFMNDGTWMEWRMIKEKDRRTFLAQSREAYKAMANRVQRDGALALIGAPRKRAARGELRGFGQAVAELLPGADHGDSTTTD